MRLTEALLKAAFIMLRCRVGERLLPRSAQSLAQSYTEHYVFCIPVPVDYWTCPLIELRQLAAGAAHVSAFYTCEIPFGNDKDWASSTTLSRPNLMTSPFGNDKDWASS
jgi:hypothetical protein